MLTALRNRVGDALLIALISLLASDMGWLCYDFFYIGAGSLLVGLLVFSSITKRAQIPFSSWLPAAMAAPTPVSALVHSSTLVTAGVYVLFRFASCLGGFWMYMLTIFSFMTLVLAGLTARLDYDLKKVVAYSTLRQLGVMVLSLSVGAKDVCFFHLVTHAFFKALMFLCVGAMIALRGGLQDIRFLGGLWYKMPVTCSWFISCCVALIGLPFTSGYYSKDLIVERCVSSGVGAFGVLLLYFSVFLTSVYSGRLFFILFRNTGFCSTESFNEGDQFLMTSLSLLGVGAVFRGVILQRCLVSFSYFRCVTFVEKLSILVCCLMGLGCGYVFRCARFFVELEGKSSVRKYVVAFEWLLSKLMYLPYLSGNMLRSVVLRTISRFGLDTEKGWIESFL